MIIISIGVFFGLFGFGFGQCCSSSPYKGEKTWLLKNSASGELSVDFRWGISSVIFCSPGGTGYTNLDLGFQNADLENEALREVGTVGIFGFPPAAAWDSALGFLEKQSQRLEALMVRKLEI
ncbi:mechanosensitive ion channel protein 10-like [Pyrus ussuriensis x Pyrus communis]|uniref:Mechanosensitive ion channel protein 10-like n=1 Tax=Pyrus ussuriensis x Pyrus communis TaxID=2448454 RepID=A0A5N5FR02_9ROSA|nr:mechanosensitive ion channel protein 10-like [Pyrus ussuriensis x Pyrus communis]KAB2620282.1 mechanosensitive ion channel protein 10-like [Pyrus ussuriensis x Pyrus communis]